MTGSKSLLLTLAACATLGACGTGDPDDETPTPSPSASPTLPSTRLFPMKVGATWTYRVTDISLGTVETKSSTVQAFEAVGDRKPGLEAFRIRTEKEGGYVVSWQQDTGTAILRHREQSFDDFGAIKSEEIYDPAKVRLDEAPDRVAQGATWTDAWTEIHIDPVTGEATAPRSAAWTVESTRETITVPAGTFECIRFRRISSTESGIGSDKTFWFAVGVGKVKESGAKIEELMSWSVP